MDREKVIKGFTVCSEHGLLNGEDCHGHYEYTDNLADIIKANDYSKQCPYNKCETGCVKTLAKDVLALLKEQEAVEPYVTGRGETFETAETWWYACGNCHEALDVNDKYCRHCGRLVKW